MKKFIAAILAVLYLGTSNGAAIHMHYCMGKLVDWSLWHSSSSFCNKCGMEMKHGSNDGCCKNEYKKLDNKKDQKLTETTFYFLQSVSTATPTYSVELTPINISTITECNPVSNAPPRSQVSLFVLHRVFLI